METRKNKHVEVQFVADQDVGREIISIKDMKNKKIGINIKKYFSNAYTLKSAACKSLQFRHGAKVII
jgi:hypothetical protein